MNASCFSNSLLSCGIVLLSVFTVSAQPGASGGKCDPVVDTSSVLNSINVNGSLRISDLVVRCLPVPARKSKTAFTYNPYDGGKFSTTLKDSKGETLNTFVWYGRSVLSFWEMDRYEVVGGPEALKKLTTGNYQIEFAIEDKVFQRFPFSVTTRESSDQFRPETLYFLEGAWRDYAQLYAPNLDRFIKLGVWLRLDDSATDPKQKPFPFTLTLIREGDKKLLAENVDGGSLLLDTKWHYYDLSFRRPNAALTKDYSEFKLNEILAVDGRYRLALKLEGRAASNYVLTVKNGMINGLDPVQMRKDNFRVIIPLKKEKIDLRDPL